MKNRMRITDGDKYFCDNCGFEPTYKGANGKLVNYRGDLKFGWDNGAYCCKECEQAGVGRLFASMPGHGGSPKISRDVQRQIDKRWQ